MSVHTWRVLSMVRRCLEISHGNARAQKEEAGWRGLALRKARA